MVGLVGLVGLVRLAGLVGLVSLVGLVGLVGLPTGWSIFFESLGRYRGHLWRQVGTANRSWEARWPSWQASWADFRRLGTLLAGILGGSWASWGALGRSLRFGEV